MKDNLLNTIIVILIVSCIALAAIIFLKNKKDDDIESVQIIANNQTVNVGETIKLNISIKTDNSGDYEVIWISSNESIATVNNEGIVKGLSNGEVIITAKVNDKESSITIMVVDSSIIPEDTPTPEPTVDVMTPVPTIPTTIIPSITPFPYPGMPTVTPSPHIVIPTTIPSKPPSGGKTSLNNLSISTSSLTVKNGSTATFDVALINAVGRIDITPSDTRVIKVSESMIWLESLDNKTFDKLTITVTGLKVGNTTITIDLKDVATFDTVTPITGKLTINVNVI